ncbi:uncharacterized protein [Aegilops tauschii subsp. strangulata]|uniref:uncharacterized protein n=1 Tax=Aegilops tauschii subsp. strangulata TaxID=200361 RepID=UPI003CC8DAE4
MSRWVADAVKAWILEDSEVGPTKLQKNLKKYGLAVPYMRVFYGKQMALDNIYEVETDAENATEVEPDAKNATEVEPDAAIATDAQTVSSIISGYFEGCEFLHVPRADNDQADALAQIGSTRQAIPTGVSLQRLLKPSIKPSPESDSIFVPPTPDAAGSDWRNPAGGTGTSTTGPGTAVVAPGPGTLEPGPGTAAVGPGTATTQEAVADSNSTPPNPPTRVMVAILTEEEVTAPSWAQPILKFLVSRELPADEISARLVQRRAGAYAIINRELVKRSVTGVFQRCVEPEKGVAILKDIHQGECGHHAASRSLVAKAFRHGFFWPTALEDAKEIVKSCRGCQIFGSKQHLPASALKTIPLTWPFAVWGLDMWRGRPGPLTCGSHGLGPVTYPDGPGGVNAAAIDWRGPRPAGRLEGAGFVFLVSFTTPPDGGRGRSVAPAPAPVRLAPAFGALGPPTRRGDRGEPGPVGHGHRGGWRRAGRELRRRWLRVGLGIAARGYQRRREPAGRLAGARGSH